MNNSTELNAKKILSDALQKHNVKLEILVAETAIWAHPDEHRKLASNGNVAKHPNTRRKRPKENLGLHEDSGIRLDSNNYANTTIKQAIGINYKRIVDFECCHIWPTTCYDERYHTAIPNLVLLPRALAGLTDHLESIRRILQYRSYELYGWHPVEHKAPQKPDNYPEYWRPIKPKTVRKVTSKNSGDKIHPLEKDPDQRIEQWAVNPKKNVHKIIALVLQNEGIKRTALEKKIATLNISKNPYGAIYSLAISAGNSYGHVLDISNSGTVTIRQSLAPIVNKFIWKI